ncbi:MAG: tRNA (adenosine(37)-N6)-threonylcarbamoyltransferase complex dimerization subunit type 1 TsaB [Thalassotalea sp.]|nr:tRNA (adenosine(37)-N6)-threonylcarbamoyltransferase complex dimerization subunit type 1 TsaB [Thalassotalea sp.]
MPKYLAIDASTEACSVALSLENKVISEFELCPQSHSIVLLPMIDRILKQADITLSELDGLVFGRGPGSFTGVRIGVGVAQGLAFSADLPVVGISTLQTMAQQAYEKYQQTEVIAAIDARMSEIYAGYYKLNEHGIMAAMVEETVLAPAELSQYLKEHTRGCYGVGSGWDAYSAELTSLKTNNGSPELLFPDASAMLTIAKKEFDSGNAVSAEHAQPVYVRDTVSWKKLPGRE